MGRDGTVARSGQPAGPLILALGDEHIICRCEIYVLADTAVRWIPATSVEDKRRYFLVLQLDRDNHDEACPIVIGTPITTKAWGRTKQDVWVEIGESDLKERSLVKLSVLQPVAKQDLLQYYGRVKHESMQRITAALAVNLGILRP